MSNYAADSIERQMGLVNWVTIAGLLDQGPFPVVLDTGPFVWVAADYSTDLLPGMVQVGDGRSNGFDRQGHRIVSVPEELCKFYSDDDAMAITECLEVDQQLLSYAR